MISAFFTILGLVAVYIGLVAHGILSPDRAAECLIALVILLAIGQAMRTGLIGALFRVGVPVISVLALAAYYSNGNRDEAITIIANVCAIGLVLFGVFIMLAGPFRR